MSILCASAEISHSLPTEGDLNLVINSVTVTSEKYTDMARRIRIQRQENIGNSGFLPSKCNNF